MAKTITMPLSILYPPSSSSSPPRYRTRPPTPDLLPPPDRADDVGEVLTPMPDVPKNSKSKPSSTTPTPAAIPMPPTLDAVVDFADLVQLAQNYNTVGGMSWVDGDFNSDFTVDFNDLVLMAQNYNTSLPGGAAPIPGAPIGFDADLARAFAEVPEPGGGGGAIIAACGFALVPRRRRSGNTRMEDGR